MVDSIIYKKLVEHMDEAVCMSDKDSKTLYANPRFCKLLGYSQSEIIKLTTWDFVDDESRKKIEFEEKNKRQKWESSRYSINLKTKSWKIIPIVLNGTPLPDGSSIGIMTDVSRTKRQREIYEQLIEHMDEAVCMTDINQDVIYANPKLCNLLGKKSDEIVGRSANSFLDKESQKKVAHVDEKERKRWKSSSYDINIVTKLWNMIPIALNGTPLPGGWTIGIMTDMREMKAKEENEKVLYNAVQYSTDGIVICDVNGNITFWNKWAQMIFGMKHDEVIAKNLSLFFLKKDITEILNEQEGITKYQLKAKHKNKSKMDISITQTPILDTKKKNTNSYLLICRDITNHRKIEEEIESKYRKIREVYEWIGIIKRQSDYMFDLLEMFENYHYDTKSIGDFIVTSVIMLTRVDACALRIYDKKSDKLKMISSFGFSEWWEWKSAIKFKKSLIEKAYKTRTPLKIMDLNKEPLHQSLSLARKNNLTSLLLIPLTCKWKLVGSLSLYTKADKKLEIFENEFIEKYAKIIQLVLGNSL